VKQYLLTEFFAEDNLREIDLGGIVAHLMFDVPIIDMRDDLAQSMAEFHKGWLLLLMGKCRELGQSIQIVTND